MTIQQGKLILNSFIIPHTSYLSIVWMFHSQRVNKLINNIHERAYYLTHYYLTCSCNIFDWSIHKS